MKPIKAFVTAAWMALMLCVIPYNNSEGQLLPNYRFSVDSASRLFGLLGPNYDKNILKPGPQVCFALPGPPPRDVTAYSLLDNLCGFAFPPGPNTWYLVLFSVDRFTKGLPLTIIRNQADGNGAAGDVFAVAGPPWSHPFLLDDATALGLIPKGQPGPESDLDAIEIHSNCPSGKNYYFSHKGTKDIIDDQGTTTQMVSLQAGDVIDALAMAGTCVTFSLAPGSPSLGSLYHPADMLATTPPFGAFIKVNSMDHFTDFRLCDLGTPGCPQDNIDAFWYSEPGESGLGIVIINDCRRPVTYNVPSDSSLGGALRMTVGNPAIFAFPDTNISSPVCSVKVEVRRESVQAHASTGAATTLAIPQGHSGTVTGLTEGTYSYKVSDAQDSTSFTTGTIVVCITIKGDMDTNSVYTAADVVLLLNCAFVGTGRCDYCFADVNCDGVLTAADVVLELNKVFLDIPFPCP